MIYYNKRVISLMRYLKQIDLKKPKGILWTLLNIGTPEMIFSQVANQSILVNNSFFLFCYHLQISTLWHITLFISSLVYMYLIIFEPNNHYDLSIPFNKKSFFTGIALLIIFWLDVGLEIYHKSFWKIKQSKYTQKFYYKITLLTLFTIDQIIFYCTYSYYPLRIFRILRPFLPYFYDYFSRKAFISLIYAYQDIIIFIMLHTCIMVGCGVIGTQLIQIPPGMDFDEYNENYKSLPKMIFLIYILASYDAWPDYQELAIKISSWHYLFFLTFIFMNCFYFVTIPTTMYFSSFKVTRSKISLIDQIKRQNSLLLCFICLGQSNLCIKSQTFHQFMLYIYKNKLQYIDYIKDISFELDQNNRGQIFISEFMKLCKIIEKNQQMLPPTYQDRQFITRIRKYINQTFYIKKIVKSDIFQIIINCIIISNFIFILVCFFGHSNPSKALIQNIYLAIYCIEMFMRLIASGPERYIKDRRNLVDIFIVIFSFVFQFIVIVNVSIALIQLVRLIRIYRIEKLFFILNKYDYMRSFLFYSVIFRKLKVMLRHLYISVIIGIRMFPIFLTVFYVLGIIGIEFYDTRFAPPTSTSSPYTLYQSISNFSSFIGSQLVNVQIMIEAGWSIIVFDTAFNFGNFGIVIIYFIFCHIMIVIVIVAWMKGLVGDLYETVKNIYEQIWQEQQNERIRKKAQIQKEEELKQIKRLLQQNLPLKNDSIKKKQIYQNKLDRKLMTKLKSVIGEQSKISKKKIKSMRNIVLSDSAKQIFSEKKKSLNHQESGFIPKYLITEQAMNDSSIVMQDIDQFQNQFLERIILKQEQIPYFESPIYPAELIDFLKNKLKIHHQKHQENLKFDINRNLIEQNGIQFYTNQMQSLLEIKKSEKQRKKQILQDILKLKISDRKQIQRKLKKERKYQTSFFSIDKVLKSIYLSNTSQNLIKKFEIEYYSDIYGSTFRTLNRATLQPMLKLESFLIYNLMKLFRYPEMEHHEFFHMLATIQIKITQNLLKQGSIFKFVFQVQGLGNNWFTIEVNQAKQIKIHFLKSGIWIYHANMLSNQIYYAHDIFSQSEQKEILSEYKSKQKIIRLLYNSFETLAFSMLDQSKFFNSDPADNVYDLYTYFTDCLQMEYGEQVFNPFRISKVMIIVLSRQYQRPPENKLKYSLTNLKSILSQRKEKQIQNRFKFEDDNDEMYQKLKLLSQQQKQNIVSSEGLPYCYMVDMIKSIKDILKIYKRNLISKAEKILMQEFSKIK